MPYITVIVTPFQHAVLGTKGDEDNGNRDVVCVTVLALTPALTPALTLAFTPADATARPSRLPANGGYGGFGYRFIVPCAFSSFSSFSAFPTCSASPLTPLVDRFVEEFRDADSEADGNRKVVGGESGTGETRFHAACGEVLFSAVEGGDAGQVGEARTRPFT